MRGPLTVTEGMGFTRVMIAPAGLRVGRAGKDTVIMTERAETHHTQPSRVVRVFRPLARGWLWLCGFRVLGTMPDVPKFIVVAAPHKTNWDLPHALAAGIIYGSRIHWMGKSTLFKWPFGGFMRWLGGIPVDRSKSTNAVAEMVREFGGREHLTLVIPPEGTRRDVTRWKSGFYHIAVGAKVPLALAFIDYTGRRIGVAGVFHPTGDYEADIVKILAIYTEVTGKQQPQGS